jgi:uncharacterized cupredoxin-like copper-binding protein
MMAAAPRSKARSVAAIVAAAVVLGVLSTLAMAGLGGGFGGPFGESPRPGFPPWASGQAAACDVPALPGQVVQVRVADMGAMMGGRPGYPGRGGMMDGYPGYQEGPNDGRPWGPGMGMGRMTVLVDPVQVHAGQVSLKVDNIGWRTHEMVVLPLAAGQAIGQRPVGLTGKIEEAGSLGEVSGSCAAGSGDGLLPGATGWTTLALQPGRYELVCNLPGHYAAGMYAELEVIP